MPCKTGKASLFRGLFYAMVSGAFSSLISMIVKQMKNLHPGQLALYRFIATFIMCMPGAAKTCQNPFGPRELRFFLVLRGVFGGFAYFLSFISYRYLSLGEASVIFYSSPVVVTVYARMFFKEPCSISQSISVVLMVVGMVFTAKLPARWSEGSIAFSSEKIYGLVAAFLSLFCISGIQLVTRKTRSVHQSIIVFNFCFVSIVEIVILTAILGDFKWQYCGIQTVYVLLLAIFSYISVIAMVMALQCEFAGPVATVRAASDVGLAFVWQIFIFRDMPDSYGIIGAVLVLVSIIIVSLDKWITSLKCNFFSMW